MPDEGNSMPIIGRNSHFNAEECEGGRSIEDPHDGTAPEYIFTATLAGADKAVHNFRSGQVSVQMDLSDY